MHEKAVEFTSEVYSFYGSTIIHKNHAITNGMKFLEKINSSIDITVKRNIVLEDSNFTE